MRGEAERGRALIEGVERGGVTRKGVERMSN